MAGPPGEQERGSHPSSSPLTFDKDRNKLNVFFTLCAFLLRCSPSEQPGLCLYFLTTLLQSAFLYGGPSLSQLYSKHRTALLVVFHLAFSCSAGFAIPESVQLEVDGWMALGKVLVLGSGCLMGAWNSLVVPLSFRLSTFMLPIDMLIVGALCIPNAMRVLDSEGGASGLAGVWNALSQVSSVVYVTFCPEFLTSQPDFTTKALTVLCCLEVYIGILLPLSVLYRLEVGDAVSFAFAAHDDSDNLVYAAMLPWWSVALLECAIAIITLSCVWSLLILTFSISSALYSLNMLSYGQVPPDASAVRYEL